MVTDSKKFTGTAWYSCEADESVRAGAGLVVYDYFWFVLPCDWWWWQRIVFLIATMFIFGVLAIEQWETQMPVWALILALVMALLYIIPVGVLMILLSSLSHYLICRSGWFRLLRINKLDSSTWWWLATSAWDRWPSCTQCDYRIDRGVYVTWETNSRTSLSLSFHRWENYDTNQ